MLPEDAKVEDKRMPGFEKFGLEAFRMYLNPLKVGKLIAQHL